MEIAKALAPISEEEIDILKRVVGHIELEVTVEPFKFEVGDKVEILRGSLAGVKGTLVETKKNKFVVVEFQNIGFSLHIMVQNNDVRKMKS